MVEDYEYCILIRYGITKIVDRNINSNISHFTSRIGIEKIFILLLIHKTILVFLAIYEFIK